MSIERADAYRDAHGNIDWLAYSQARGVEGFIHPSELSLLVELATGKDYLEIGSFRGLSAWCVAHVAKHLTCVDTFKARDNGQDQEAEFTTLAVFDRNLAPFWDKVNRLPVSSERAAELIGADASWDVIFLDAMHTYEDVKADIERWWPRVRPGGVLALHDYAHDHFPGVQQAVDEVFGRPEGPWVVTTRVVRKSK